MLYLSWYFRQVHLWLATNYMDCFFSLYVLSYIQYRGFNNINVEGDLKLVIDAAKRICQVPWIDDIARVATPSTISFGSMFLGRPTSLWMVLRDVAWLSESSYFVPCLQKHGMCFYFIELDPVVLMVLIFNSISFLEIKINKNKKTKQKQNKNSTVCVGFYYRIFYTINIIIYYIL